MTQDTKKLKPIRKPPNGRRKGHDFERHITAACRQALAATDGRPVVVVIKDDRRPAIVLEHEAADWEGPVLPVRRIRTIDLEAAEWVNVDVAGDVWLAMSLGYWLECCGLDRGGEE